MHCIGSPASGFIDCVLRLACCAGWLLLAGCSEKPATSTAEAAQPTLAQQLEDVRAGRSDSIIDSSLTSADDFLADLSDELNLVRIELPKAVASNRALDGLRRQARLQVLVLGPTTFSNDALAELAKLQELRRLNLPSTDADDDGLAMVATLPQLESLRIGGRRLTDAGLAKLAAAKSLRHLILRDAPITDAGLKHLTTLPKLESLYLDGTNVTEAGARYLEQTRPDLHVHFP